MGLADDRKQVNLMTVHVSKSVTVHEVSNNKTGQARQFSLCILSNIEINYKKNYFLWERRDRAWSRQKRALSVKRKKYLEIS